MRHAIEFNGGAGTDQDTIAEMSLEIDRIAKTLAKLSQKAPEAAPLPLNETGNQLPHFTTSLAHVSAVIKARGERCRFFPSDLFADPAWDLLLQLFHAELGHYRLTVSKACRSTDVPSTTCLRWLKVLENQSLVTRRRDPFDGRRIFLELSKAGSIAMNRYFGISTSERPVHQV